MTDAAREELLDGWEQAAKGWGRQAERWAEAVAPVTEAMLAAAQLDPAKRVLELAAGPGDLSRRAAELVAPTTVLCTDGVEAMVEVAREAAEEAGVTNIAFQRTQLEWIDLPAASVDVILCRYGVMLTVDPEAALRECRRVLASGGRLVIAVQAAPADNPWLVSPISAAQNCGLMTVAAPGGPGPFALADRERLAELIATTGFFDVQITDVVFTYEYRDELDWIGEKIDHSPSFAAVWRELEDERRAELRAELRRLAEPHLQNDGSLRVPGRALVAIGEA